MNPDTHALAGAYAVNAVTQEERDSFETHLEQCPDCRAEVAELRAAAATLTSDVELAPPPALRASVLSAISQTRQLSPLTETSEPSAPPVTVMAQDPARIGTLAAERLFDRLGGSTGPEETLVVPATLVVRGSGEIAPPAR